MVCVGVYVCVWVGGFVCGCVGVCVRLLRHVLLKNRKRYDFHIWRVGVDWWEVVPLIK